MKKEISTYSMQEMAALSCGLSDEKFEEIVDSDEDFDTPLMQKLGVDFEQFSAVVESILNSGNLKIGFSVLSKTIVLGLQRGNCSVGHRIDISSDFLQVVEQKFELNTSTNLTDVNGVVKCRILCIDAEREMVVNGKVYK